MATLHWNAISTGPKFAVKLCNMKISEIYLIIELDIGFPLFLSKKKADESLNPNVKCHHLSPNYQWEHKLSCASDFYLMILLCKRINLVKKINYTWIAN